MKTHGAQAQGALYRLVHQKANALSAMKESTKDILSELSTAWEDEERLARLLARFEALDAQTEAINQLDKRIAFLQDSGYEPSNAEAQRITLEMGTIAALLKDIDALDAAGIAAIEQTKVQLMEEMKQVRDGQKSLQAYSPPAEEENGQQMDTFR